MRVGLAATDRGLPQASTPPRHRSPSPRPASTPRIARLAAQGAELVVLPEKMIGVTPQSAGAVMNVLGDAARAAHVTVIAGLSRNAVQPRRNVAVVFSPDGTHIAEYEKRYPVPIIERDFVTGDNTVLSRVGRAMGRRHLQDLISPPGARLSQVGAPLACPWDRARPRRIPVAVSRRGEWVHHRSLSPDGSSLSGTARRIYRRQSSETDQHVVEAFMAWDSAGASAMFTMATWGFPPAS